MQSEDPIQDGKLRSANFQAVSVLYHNGQTIVAEGLCPGRISHNESGDEGFGFDPIFVPADLEVAGDALEVGEIGSTSTHGRTFASISLEEKQLYSHRSRALASLVTYHDNLG